MDAIGTALVVKDEPYILIDMADTLALAGNQVVTALSADRAVTLLASGLEIDFLVTDVNTPGSLDDRIGDFFSDTVPSSRIVVTSGRYDVEAMVPTGLTFIPKPVASDAVLRNLGIPMGKAA